MFVEISKNDKSITDITEKNQRIIDRYVVVRNFLCNTIKNLKEASDFSLVIYKKCDFTDNNYATINDYITTNNAEIEDYIFKIGFTNIQKEIINVEGVVSILKETNDIIKFERTDKNFSNFRTSISSGTIQSYPKYDVVTVPLNGPFNYDGITTCNSITDENCGTSSNSAGDNGITTNPSPCINESTVMDLNGVGIKVRNGKITVPKKESEGIEIKDNSFIVSKERQTKQDEFLKNMNEKFSPKNKE